jgi:hypothetical protein
MRLFLDTSVMLSASASTTGASRELFKRAGANGWHLITTPYAIEEVIRHIPDMVVSAATDWPGLKSHILILDDVLSLELPAVFPVTKDRPILFGAMAWADVLLTLDRGDFETLLGTSFYGLPILTPGAFLRRERDSGRLT